MTLKKSTKKRGWMALKGKSCLKGGCVFLGDGAESLRSLNRFTSLASWIKILCRGGFPGGTVVKNPPANAGDTGSSPGPGRSHVLWSN